MAIKKSEGDMISAIKKTVSGYPNPENFPTEIINEIFSILQKNQYKINRERPKELIKRLIESKEWNN